MRVVVILISEMGPVCPVLWSSRILILAEVITRLLLIIFVPVESDVFLLKKREPVPVYDSVRQ